MVPSWIFDWAERTPDKVAAVYNDQPITYRQFAWLIMRTRAYFHRQGVGGPGIAAVLVGNLMDFWFASLALRSLGLTTVTAKNTEALASLSLKGVTVAVTSAAEDWPRLDELCAAQGWRQVLVSVEGGDQIAPEAGPGILDGGHILATSGTTGVYKKVLTPPAMEAEFCALRARVRKVDASSVEAMFDFGAWTGVGYKSAITAWRYGATVLFQQNTDPERLLARGDATHTVLNPMLLDRLLAAPSDAYGRNDRMLVSMTSASITAAQLQAIKERISTKVVNALGSTEADVYGHTFMNAPEDHRWHVPVPGRLVQIVDDDHQPVPVGQVGHLRVDAAGVNAYVDDEDASARFFRGGFFYPGDLAVAREDGRIALEGRATDVINLAGMKISPAPIEDALREAFGVVGVCLFTQQDAAGQEQLHVVIEPARPVPTEALVRTLRAHIQAFPGAHVHYVDALPRDPAGKLQRREARALAMGLPTA